MPDERPLLEIRDLKTHFFTSLGEVKAVDGMSLDIRREEIVAVVGESGCGKSVAARSVLGIIPPPGRIVSGRILYYGEPGGEPVDLAGLDAKGDRMRALRGREIAMVFQEPMSCLSPVHTVGNQLGEAVRLYGQGVSRHEARIRSIALLRQVGIPAPEKLIDAHAFELSGGMRQRILIAMAISGRPQLLIADEPTTAIDATIQGKVLDLLKELQAASGMSILYITHNLGVVAELAHQVVVMYLGTVAEQGRVSDIFARPRHPYTRALLESIPTLDTEPQSRLATIEGSVPDPRERPPGCPFSNRCPRFMQGVCDVSAPPLCETEPGHRVRCFLYGGDGAQGSFEQ